LQWNKAAAGIEIRRTKETDPQGLRDGGLRENDFRGNDFRDSDSEIPK
jgi:hypothetical protein